MKKLRNFFRGTYLGLMLIFLYAPILVLMVFSFNGSKSMARWTGFSFKWYEALMHDSTIMNALIVTLSVAVISALVATFIGTFAAIGIHSMKKRPRAVVENISRLPMVNPDLVTGISFMMLFSALGIKGSYTRMLIAHITFNIPYVIFSVMPKLRQIDPNLAEAAQDLGATPMQGFFKVILPDIMPGVFSGFVMALTMSIDDFVISYFTAGSTFSTLSMVIYSMAKKRVSPEINALTAIIFVVVLALLLLSNYYSARKEKQMMRKEEPAA